METKVNYTLVGAFVMALILAMVVIALWLSTGITHKNYKTYLVLMDESVSGVNYESPVKYNGVEVGFVYDIRLNANNLNQAVLKLKIDPTVPITTKTTATIMQQGLTGLSYIGLQGGNHSPLLQPLPGQKYAVIKTVPSMYKRLQSALENLQAFFDPGNREAFKNILIQLDSTTKTLSANRDSFAQGMRSLPRALNSVQQSASKFGKTSSNISNQILPQVSAAMENIQDITNTLKPLAEDLQQNPSIILSGKGQSAKGPGE